MIFRAACGLAAALTCLTTAASTPQPPAGWKMELIAAAPVLRHPSVVCCAPDGRVFVAEDPMDISTPHADAAEGRILCFRPDGSHIVFADHLHAVFGMQYLEGKLYVLHNPEFTVFGDSNGVATNRFDLIASMNPNPWALDWNDHVPANFKLAMDGYFYVATGDKGVYGAIGKDGRRLNMHSGGVFRLRPDGTGLEVYATGVRNILDLALNEEDEIFTYDNTDEHDWMGRLTHMVDGGFYGYPHDFVPRRPYTLWMMHDFGGGAACDTLCYTEDALAENYHEDLFLADFGKRQVLRVKLKRAADTYELADWEEFFPNPPEDFRPVGIAWGADGLSFYLCDWQHADTKEAISVGRLWKASWTGPDQSALKPAWYLPTALGQPCSATTAGLIAALAHRSKNVRLLAQRQLSERKAVGPLTKVLQDRQAPPQARWHAIWALNSIDNGRAGRREILRAATADPDDRVQRQAIRQLGLRRATEAETVLRGVLTNAALRFQAATALGRIGDVRSIPSLLALLNQTNLFSRFAAFTALNRIGRANPSAWSAIVQGLDLGEAVREGARSAMRETYEVRLIEALVSFSQKPAASPAGRIAALEVLASLALRLPEWKGEWWAYHPALAPPPPKTEPWEGTDRIRRALTEALNHPAPEIRLAAVEGLRGAGATNSAARLRAHFEQEADLKVRIALVNALGDFRATEFTPTLARLLHEPRLDPELLSAAVRSAGLLGGNELRASLLELAAASRVIEAARIQAISLLGQWKATEALATLEPLLSSDSTALRTAAQRAIAHIGGPEALRMLRAQLQIPTRKREAVIAIGQMRDREAVPDLIDAWRQPDTKDVALAGLAEVSDSRALEPYLAGLGSPNVALREQCLKALKPVRDQVLPAIEQQAETLSPEVIRSLRGLYEDLPAAKSGPLFATRLHVLEAADYDRYASEHRGDPVNGQRLFFDERGAACIKCHAIAGQGGAVGPDLTLIGAQFPRATLIESVLYPSRVVREGYQQITLEMNDGETLSGLIKTESAGSITLVDASAKAVEVSKPAIARRQTSQLSLMPEGLQAGLTLAEFSDLIAFLELRRSDPRQSIAKPVPQGFRALFNGRDLSGWRELPDGTKRVEAGRGALPQHWQVINGVLEHDGQAGDLWTEAGFADFELSLEWRWVDRPVWADFPVIGPDGVERLGTNGVEQTAHVLDAGDSGVLLRGLYKAQANLFCYPVGSGELWEYRTDAATTPAQRQAFTPSRQGDRPIGDWNLMTILVKGNRLTVVLNEQEVIHAAALPGLPERGPIGFQHEHGRIQFRNVWIRE